MMRRKSRFIALAIGAITATAGGCIISDVDLEGLPCPCASTEWQCDRSTATCVRADPGPFSLAITPASVLVPRSGRSLLQVELTSATDQLITVTLANLPDGVAASPGELTLSPANPRGELTLTASMTTPMGSSVFDIEGIGPGGNRERASVALEIGDESGSLDASFGVDGFAVRAPGVLTGQPAMALRDDDRIVVVASGESSCVVVQHTVDGQLDDSFGTEGVAVTSTGQADVVCIPSDVQILDNGKVLVAGARDLFPSAPILIQYLPGGGLDPSFGSGGIVVGETGFRLSKIAVRRDGKVIGVGLGENTAPERLALFRFLADGSLDPSFGIDGRRIVPAPLAGVDLVGSVSLGPDDSFVVAGTIFEVGAESRGFLARFSADGSLDESFAGGVAFGGANTLFTVVARGPAGSLLVGGMQSVALGGSSIDGGSFVARYRPDGRLDPDFGENGITEFVSTEPLDAIVTGIITTPVSRLLVADTRLLMTLDAGGQLDADYGYVQLPNVGLVAIAAQQSGKLIGLSLADDSFLLMRLWP